MRATELYNLLEQNKEKLTLIDQIQNYHPGMGTELGWSYYTGGMTDTGDWILEKLIKVPYHLLQSTLDKWRADTFKALEETKAEDARRKRYEDEGRLGEYYDLLRKETDAQVRQWKDKLDSALIWGKNN